MEESSMARLNWEWYHRKKVTEWVGEAPDFEVVKEKEPRPLKRRARRKKKQVVICSGGSEADRKARIKQEILQRKSLDNMDD
jgi:hypothetical protein